MNINEQPDRRELLEADFSWWLHFFAPALQAYNAGDYDELKNIVDRYNEFITYQGD